MLKPDLQLKAGQIPPTHTSDTSGPSTVEGALSRALNSADESVGDHLLRMQRESEERKAESLQPSSPDAHRLLEMAGATISQRGKDYNSPGGERSMAQIVEMFNTLWGLSLTTEQGWSFMVLLKMVRATKSPDKMDHYLDLASYSVLWGEEALK